MQSSHESGIFTLHTTNSLKGNEETHTRFLPITYVYKEEIIQTVTNVQHCKVETIAVGKEELLRMSRFKESRCPPGRRWVVLVASFLTLIVSTGFPFNMSVLYVEFLMAFGKSKAVTSLVQSVSAGVFFLSGVGLSVSYIGTLSSVAEYFDGRLKPLALSVAMSGSGIGSITFPILLNLLISRYGWKGCLLVVSGIAFNIVPCIAICKPRYPSKLSQKHTSTCDHVKKAEAKHWHHPLRSLLRNKVYVFNTFALALCIPFCNAVLFMLIDFLNFKGFTRDIAVSLYFYMTLTNAVFRIIPGLCKQLPHLSVLVIAMFFSGLGTVSLVVFPLVNTYIQYVCTIIVFGASVGGIMSIMPMTIMKIVGRDIYSTGLGVTLSVNGVLNIASGPIVGFIRDVTGSYDIAFYVCGTCTGVGCVLFCCALCLRSINGLDTDVHNKMDPERKKESLDDDASSFLEKTN